MESKKLYRKRLKFRKLPTLAQLLLGFEHSWIAYRVFGVLQTYCNPNLFCKVKNLRVNYQEIDIIISCRINDVRVEVIENVNID